MDSAGGEWSMRKEAEEESGKRSETAGLRCRTPRRKKAGLRSKLHGGLSFALPDRVDKIKEPVVILAGMDSAGGECSMRKEAEETLGKISEMQHEWMKRPGESEPNYERRLRDLKQPERGSDELRKKGMPRRLPEAGKAEETVTVGSGKSAMNQEALRAKVNKMQVGLHSTKKVFPTHSQDNLPTKKAKAKDEEPQKPVDFVTEAGKAEAPMPEAGKAKKSVTEVGKAEVSVTEAGKAETPMTEAVKPEESVIETVEPKESVTEAGKAEESDQEARRAMVKSCQERMAMTEKAHGLEFPTKDEELADPSSTNSVTIQDDHLDRGESALAKKTADEKAHSLEFPTKVMAKAKDEESADPSSTNSMAIQDDHLDRDKSALATKTADQEAADYARYILSWESVRCKYCHHFENLTVLSSMQFTHYTPEMISYNRAGTAVDTLQIFYMKLKLTNHIAGGFELPLSVYGVVAVRDGLDSRRNILFSRSRTRPQELTQDDPFLHLTGPSRAIVSMGMVCFEIQLKVKGAAASQDKPLITCARRDSGSWAPDVSTLCFKNVFCTLELCLQPVKQTVQATILGVQIVKKKELWPLIFAHGGLVACTPLPRMTRSVAGTGVSSNQIVLIESKGRAMLTGVRGYVQLRRQVVSVERRGGLDVVVQAYSKSGAVHAEGHVHFTPQDCYVSQQKCIVGQAQVTVAVAWSLGPKDMNGVVECGHNRI